MGEGERKEFLVLKCGTVVYSSFFEKIDCFSCDGDDDFEITDVKPYKVKGRNVNISIGKDGIITILGNELWSDGEHYIIKTGPEEGDEGE